MKTRFLGLLATLLVSFASFGQQWETEMLKPNANFYDIQNAFNQEWENKTYIKGSGYKQFKRWENFWETRIMPDGSFPMQHKAIWSSFKSLLFGGAQKSGGIGNWSPLGPFTHTNTDSWSSGTGRVNCIVEDPNNSSIIYIGAPAGGVWKSTDAGATWIPLGDELSVIGVTGIAIDPSNSNIIYLATGDTDGGDTYSIGVMKSTDGGLTWNEVGGVNANETTEILIDPTNSNNLWLASSQGLLKSTDAGVNWTTSLSGTINDIAFKPGVESTIYAVTSSDFYKSTDSGANWTNITNGLPANPGRLAIAVTPANNSYVYILASKTDWSYEGVYRSTNSGTSFNTMNTTTDIFESTQAWYDMAITASPTDANTIVTGVLNLWRSTNGGSNFTQLNSWSAPNSAGYTHADIHFLRYYNGNLYCGSDGGIYRSTNNGTTFTDLSAGLQIGQFYRIGASQNDVTTITGGLQDNGGYAYVGGTWKVWYGADGMEAGVDPNNSNIIFGMIQFGDLYRSTNGANTNSGQGSPEQGRWVTPMQMDPNNARLLAGYNDLHEFDYATGWNQISTFNFPQLLRSIEIYDANSDIIIVGTNGNLYKTTDGGTNFTEITNGLSSIPGTITSIEVNPTDPNEMWVTFGGWNAANHVFHTSDNGANWNNLTSGLPNLPCNIVKYDPAGTGGIYVGTDIGVYYYDNLTASWVQYMNNLPNVIVNDLEINYNANVIRAGTYGRGVWESGVYTISDNDIGISAVVSPIDAYCNTDTFDPIVTLTNYGALTITSATITYDIDGGPAQVFNWTGSLISGASEDVTLATMTTTGGPHVFNAYTSMPNGVADQEVNNDPFAKSFTVTLGGEIVDFQIIPDCWGSEITWELLDGATQVASGGPYSDGTEGIAISESYCIAPSCFDFIIYDSYGDGMYGTQWACAVDGYYQWTNSAGDTLAELIAVNADYGNSETNPFCLAAVLSSGFQQSTSSICPGATIDFTDNSNGTPTTWEWNFTGGNPATSSSQNPTGISYAASGSYDVQLIVSDGVSADTLTMTNVVTVNPVYNITETVTTCSDYYWPTSGVTYTTGGLYTEVLQSVDGCDSIVNLDLTFSSSAATSQTVAACDSYTWPTNGQTYTSGGTFAETLTASSGCDSIVTLYLTVNTSNAGAMSATECDSYTWAADGQTYSSSGVYTATLTNVSGCDSMATLNLIITNSTTGVESVEACDSYTWIDGITYTSSNNSATYVLTNAAGCDSTVTLDLAINTVDATANSVSDTTLEAQLAGALYQWVDCDDNYAAIAGATNQQFTPVSNGNYAVIVSDVNCTDTSACLPISVISVDEYENWMNLSIFPNPTDGSFTVVFNELYTVDLQLFDVQGKLLVQKRDIGNQEGFDIQSFAEGMYLVRLSSEYGTREIRLVKR